MTATVEEQQLVTSDVPEKATHIVPVPDHLKGRFSTPQAYVLAARLEGAAVVALCGYVFVPQQDPEKFPICTGCHDAYMTHADKYGDRDRLPDA